MCDGSRDEFDCGALLAGAGRRGDERRVGGGSLGQPAGLPCTITYSQNAKQTEEQDLSFSRAAVSLDSASRARCSAADRRASEYESFVLTRARSVEWLGEEESLMFGVGCGTTSTWSKLSSAKVCVSLAGAESR